MSKYDNYHIFDDPIPYKSLLIYPAKMRDYLYFNHFASVLTLDKNSIPDIKIIQMSYLEYLYYETQRDMENNPYLIWFDRLLSIVLRGDESFKDLEKSIRRYKYDEKGKPFFEISGVKYNSDDFEKIREIIVDQNGLEMIDETIQKELRDKMEEANRIRQRLNKTKICSLEEQIIGVAIYTGWDLEKVYDLTIRKFGLVLQRADHLLHYKIYLSASMSGMVEFKDKSAIKHWLSDLSKNSRFSDAMIESEAVKNKVSLSDKMTKK